jgi:hypothetical protein
MDTESDEEVSVGDESDKFPCHQKPSCSSEDSEDDEEVEPEGGTWQTISNRNVCAALPFTGPPPGVTAPNIDRSSTPLKLLKLSFTDFLLTILVQETSRYCHQYYAAKGDDSPASQDVSVEEMFLFFALILKLGHD